jgi:hypothetical protein
MERTIKDDKYGKVELYITLNADPVDGFIHDAWIEAEDRDATEEELDYFNDWYADVVQESWFDGQIGRADFLD